MIKLTEKSRRLLRAMYRGLGVGAISLSLGACPWIAYPEYGMPVMYGPGPDRPSEDIYISGRIIDKDTKKSVTGIGIWVKGVTSTYVDMVSGNGNFTLCLPKQQSFTILFTDLNGVENGLYKTYTKELSWEEAQTYAETQLIIEMEEITDAEAGAE